MEVSRNDKQQTGFSLAIIIVAVLVMAVLGYGGYRLYSHYGTPPTATKASLNQSNKQLNDMSATTPQATTYLDIRELGIKLQLSNVIRDAVYSVNGSTATLSTTSITQQSQGACSLANGGMAAVTEYNSDIDPVRGIKLVPDGETVLKLGSKYFVMTLPGAPCWSESNLGAQQRLAFREAFKTGQPDN